MTSSPDSTVPATGPADPAVGRASRVGRTRGWWGIAFVVLLLVGESAVALPVPSHTTGFIADYYARYRWAITICQVAQLVAAWTFWRFARALADVAPTPERAGPVRWSGLAVCAAAVLTSLPVLALALVPGLDPGATRTLADLTDSSDVLLFAAVAVFAGACGRATTSRWVRVAAVAVGCIALARVVAGVMGREALSVVAPLAFLALVLALAIRMMTVRPHAQ
jgi:hypothetical protein